MKHIATILTLATLFAACGGKIQIVNPTVESHNGSQPLATAQPRFCWQYKTDKKNVLQTTYRIVVASSRANAQQGIGDLWDSGVVPSSRMLYIPYQGKPLRSRSQAYWRVYATLTYGKHHRTTTTASPIQHFEISLLSPSDWHAHWIGRNYHDDNLVGHTAIAARYLRKEFPLRPDIAQARLYICGLGVYSAHINGEEVAATERLKPTLSDYTRRIYFNAYDVTHLLRADGANAVGVTLAGGRFTTVRHHNDYLEWCGIHHAVHYGLPQLLLQLEVTYRNGTTDTIVSGQGWKITNQGPIRKSNEFDGETYDARLDLGAWTQPHYDDSRWQDATVDYHRQNMYAEDIYNPRHRADRGEWPVASLGSGGRLPSHYQRPNPMQLLTPQPNPNIAVQHRLTPVRLFKKGNAWILDLGQNMVGVLSSTLSGMHPGDTITFRFAETLQPDSTLYVDNLRSAECTDRYIAARQADTWCPLFTYHGFRYVAITGLRHEPKPTDFAGLVLYDKMAASGTFETSNPTINAVYRNATWGIRGNYRSMPTDCPQRDERMGWTGDRTTGCYGESLIFDNHRLYAKWLQDLHDSQFANGALPDVAPAYWRFYTDNMTWPGAFITATHMLLTRYGDRQPLIKHYEALKRWMLHMTQHYLTDGILVRDTYGDWCVPPESPELIHTHDTNRTTRPANISTPHYVAYCHIMAQFATLLHREADALYFSLQAHTVTTAYNARYLDTATGRYATGTVTANILPLAFGMVPENMVAKVFANIVHKTEHEFGGHLSTGVVGIQHLMRTLTHYGRGDLALHLATDTTYPSWGYMATQGATTIWELWNGDTGNPAMNSGNHVMLLGDLIPWYYEYLAGIRPLEDGYRRIELKPHPIAGLHHVRCTYQSVCGTIQSHWQRRGNRFTWHILIPANTTATVHLPTAGGYQQRTLGSGHHHLSSRL